MNLVALRFIVENAEDLLIESANQTQRAPDAIVGIAKKVAAEQFIGSLSGP